MPELLCLQNSRLRVLVDPGKGAGVMACYTRTPAGELALMPDATRADCDLEWAGFLMVPYSNRIENGRFRFGDRVHQLRDAKNHAIHGDVRHRPWQVEEAATTHAVLTFDTRAHAEVNWPWAFSVRADYELQESQLACSLRLVNAADEPFPAGLGWHPFFNRDPLSGGGEEVNLCFRYTHVYPDADDNRIPSGPAAPCPPSLDFSGGRVLAPEQFIDACACGYDGKGAITWPRAGVRLVFSCSSELGHLVLYNPVGKPYFAVEPVTNANNGVNLLDCGDPTSGVRVLAPGQALHASFRLRVEQATPGRGSPSHCRGCKPA